MTDNRTTQIMNALMKWRNRSTITKIRKTAYKRTIESIQKKYLSATFKAMQYNFYHNKEVAKRLGNLANVCNHV